MKRKRVLFGSGVAFSMLLFSVGSFVALSNTPAHIDAPAEGMDSAADTATPAESESMEEEDPEFLAFEATAYCDFGITFSGVLVQRGIVAADPEILPIGSVIEVEAGDYSGVYTVMDTGGVVKGRIIDLYVPDYEEAIQFGRQEVKVRVLRHGWHPEAIPNFEHSLAG